jgi:hypothetical protein
MEQTVKLEDFSQEWLASVRDGNPSTSELGRRFARKLLTHWLDVEDASDDLVYCDGSGDGGIDIAYLHRGDSGDGENLAARGRAEGGQILRQAASWGKIGNVKTCV